MESTYRSRSRMRLGLAVLTLVLVAACSTTPPPATQDPATQDAVLILADPEAVYSGQTVEVQVAIARGDELGDSVTLSLLSDEAGITASNVITSDDVATLTIEVDPSVAQDDYPIAVRGTSGDASVDSNTVALEVQGIQPGVLRGEARSLLIPTPGGQGFTVSALPTDVRTVSLVPGDDVPIEFDEMRAVPGEVLVRFRSDATLAPTAAPATMSVGSVQLQAPASGFQPGRLQKWTATSSMSVAETIALAESLAARADVVSASPNWLFAMHQVPPPIYYQLQWHYPSIDLHAAWGIEPGSTNPVTVAVIDSGYQEHLDLVGIWLPGYDFAEGDDDPTDNDPDFSHGTHVAGTIAMRLANDPWVAGVSHGAAIVPVKVLGDDGSGTFEAVTAGMVWASGLTVPGYDYPGGVDPGANANPAAVLNLSLGGRVGPCPDEMAVITQHLANEGVVIVVSAGNSSQDAAMFAPANCPGVITVGATGPYDERAYYSNYGPDVDVFAPGGNFDFVYASENIAAILPAGVFSTSGGGLDSDYFWSQGTSMAAPHVTGMAALLLAADPGMTPSEVLAALAASATPLSEGKCDRPVGDCGFGLVNANLALGGDPAGAWDGAPTVTVSAFACTESDCGDVDPDADEPFDSRTGPLTRGYWPFDFGDVPPGEYLVVAHIAAPGTVAPLQTGEAQVSVASGETTDLIVEALPF